MQMLITLAYQEIPYVSQFIHWQINKIEKYV